MARVTCAVIGAGHLGRFHAQKYRALPDAELVAVVDPVMEKVTAVAHPLGVAALPDHHALLGRVDAVSIAVPTRQHFAIARDFLLAGSHILVEKPMTVTVAEAEELIRLAHSRDRVLAVGHIERLNAALRALDLDRNSPLFIESHRLAPFTPRCTDVSVVLDLMIHDIDIILELVDSTIDRVDASGIPVLTDDIDIANARLQFHNGCVANITASRVSLKVERRMRLFIPECYAVVDFQNRTLTRHRRSGLDRITGLPEIRSEQTCYAEGDALLEEIRQFIDCIRNGGEPLVSGEDGRRALAVASEIGTQLTRPTGSRPPHSLTSMDRSGLRGKLS